MADADILAGLPPARRRMTMKKFVRRRSTIAFVMTVPLILLIVLLVVYPALFSMYLATLNKSMERFVGFGNFEFLFKRDTFWMVVKQSCIFTVSAVFFKSLIGFFLLISSHHSGERPAQVARHAARPLGHPAGDEHARLVLAVRSILTAPSTGCSCASASIR